MKPQKLTTFLSLAAFALLLVCIGFLFLRDPINDFFKFGVGGSNVLIEEMEPYGISKKEGIKLLTLHSERTIRLQLRYLEFRCSTPETTPPDTAEYLRLAILNNSPAPEGFQDSGISGLDQDKPTIKEAVAEKLEAGKEKIVEKKKELTNKLADKDPTGLVRKKLSPELLVSFEEMPGSDPNSSAAEKVALAKKLRDLPLSQYAPESLEAVVGESILSLPDSNSNRALLETLANSGLPSASLWVTRILLSEVAPYEIEGSRLASVSRYLEIAAQAGYPEAVLQQASLGIINSVASAKNSADLKFPKLATIIERLEKVPPNFTSSASCPFISGFYRNSKPLVTPSFYLGVAHHLQALKLISSTPLEDASTGGLLSKLPEEVEGFVEETLDGSQSRLDAVLRRKSRASEHSQNSSRHYRSCIQSNEPISRFLAEFFLMTLLSDHSLQSDLMRSSSSKEAREFFKFFQDTRPQALLTNTDPIAELSKFVVAFFPGDKGRNATEGNPRYFPSLYLRSIDTELEEIQEKKDAARKILEEKERRKNLPPIDKINDLMTRYLRACSTKGADITEFIHPRGMMSFGEFKSPEQVNFAHQQTTSQTYIDLNLRKLAKGPVNTSQETWVYRVPLATDGITNPDREKRSSISYREYRFVDTPDGLKITHESIIAYALLHEKGLSNRNPRYGVISVTHPDFASLRSEPSDEKESTIIDKLPPQKVVEYWPFRVVPGSGYNNDIEWNFVVSEDVCGLVAARLIKPTSRRPNNSPQANSPKADPPDLIYLDITAKPIPFKKGWVWHPETKEHIDVRKFPSGTRVTQGGYSFKIP